jgi:hypothetical protein
VANQDKNMRHRLIKVATAGLLAAVFSTNTYAQDITDALRLGAITPQGTARSIGFGNALGSIGGDFTSLSVNPAGIGVYRKSEIMFTPSMMFSNADATYNPDNTGFGNSMSNNGSHFAISNFGMVFTTAARGRGYDRSDWKTTSFALGMNRLADFTRNYSYGGTNTTSSGSWVFEENANGFPQNIDRAGTPAYMGFQSYLLDTATLSGGAPGYVSVINPSSGSPIGQKRDVRERGGISEFVLSWGGNYREKLMLGATLGLPYVRYKRETTYREEDLSNNTNNDFANYSYTDDLRTTGIGINAKLGFIYKPVEMFRIGGAFHTPTWYGLHDRQSIGITANTENFAGINSVSAPQNEYDYNASTPWRAVASATAMLGQYGFVTVDYEYVNYKSSRFRFEDADRDYENFINDQIRSTYRGASNLRAGLEIRLDMISLRGGFGYYGSPYKESVYKDGERYDYSAGIGFRMNNSFIDFGFVHRQYKNEEQPYTVGYSNVVSPVARLTSNQNNAVLTFGWKL